MPSINPEKIGSKMALSLMADGNSLVGLPLIAAAGVVALGYFIYEEHEQAKEKAYVDKIKVVLALSEKYLAHIVILDTGETIAFPPPYQLLENGTYGKLSFTEEQLNDMAESALRAPDDIDLALYKERVVDAIQELKCYHHIHKKKKGITEDLIEYSMFMLMSKLVHFEGYSPDIAYLGGFIDWTNAIGSLSGEIDTQHFSFFGSVYSLLKMSEQELHKHKETRSIDEMMRELLGIFRINNLKLLRGLGRVITPIDDWPLVDCAYPDKLAKGVYCYEYYTRLGALKWTIPAKEFPDSRYRAIIQLLAAYHVKSLDPTLKEMNSATLQATGIFKALDKSDLKCLRKISEDCDNFMTRRLNPKRANHYIEITEDADLRQFDKVYGVWAQLLDLMNGYQFVMTQSLQFRRNFTAFKTSNPQHASRLLAMRDFLSAAIVKQAHALLDAFTFIEESNQNTMVVPDKAVFFKSMKDTVSLVSRSLVQYTQMISETLKAGGDEAGQLVKHELVEHLQWLYLRYPDAALMPVTGSFVSTASVHAEPERTSVLVPPVAEKIEVIDNEISPYIWSAFIGVLGVAVLSLLFAALQIVSLGTAGVVIAGTAIIAGIASYGLYQCRDNKDSLWSYLPSIAV